MKRQFPDVFVLFCEPQMPLGISNVVNYFGSEVSKYDKCVVEVFHHKFVTVDDMSRHLVLVSASAFHKSCTDASLTAIRIPLRFGSSQAAAKSVPSAGLFIPL